jgi:hypothetical protein
MEVYDTLMNLKRDAGDLEDTNRDLNRADVRLRGEGVKLWTFIKTYYFGRRASR